MLISASQEGEGFMLRSPAIVLFLVFVTAFSAPTALARPIRQISAQIKTSNIDGAGTNGSVYLGIGGREFLLDSEADDFEQGSNRAYKLGGSSTVENSAKNDPTNPQLDTADLDKFPIYIRFETPPSDPTSDWNVNFVIVDVEGRSFGASFAKGLWLGRKSGMVFFLREGKFGE